MSRTRNLLNKVSSDTSHPPSSTGGGGGGGGSNDGWVTPVDDDQDSVKAPYSAPSTGSRFIVPGAATGAWSGHAGEIAEWSGSAWTFSSAEVEGDQCWVYRREHNLHLVIFNDAVALLDVGFPALFAQAAGIKAWMSDSHLGYLHEAFAGPVINTTTNTPPTSPLQGYAYIIGPSPTGVWSSTAGVTASVTIAMAVRDMVTHAYKWVFRTPATDTIVWDLANSKFLRYNGSAWVGFPSLSQLYEVNVTEGAGIDGYVLTWNNATGKWIASSAPAPGAHTLVSHSDVNITTGAGIDGKVIGWDNATGKWIAMTAPVPAAHALGTHSDVTLTSPVTNQVLQYNGTAWVNATLSIPTLDGLSNVNTSGKATNDSIKWNGSSWVKWTPVLADMSDVSNASPSTGQALVWTGTQWAPGSITASVPTGSGVVAALWTGGSGSGSWTYTTYGSTGFDGSWPYYTIPSGYTKCRVTVQFGGSRTAGGSAGGGTSPSAGNEIGLIVASGALTAGLWTNVVNTFSSIAAGDRATYISPAFSATAGRRLYPLLNAGGSAPYVTTNPTYIQIELFT